MEEPEGNAERHQALQERREFQHTGELLGQISIREEKEEKGMNKEAMEGQGKRQLQGNMPIDPEVNQHTSGGEVDLVAIMKSLQIEIPEDIEVGYQGEETQKQEVNSPFKLLIKVASSSGMPRNIPLKALNNAMSSAWGEKYWFIDQIKPAMYRAYFKSEEAMDFALKKQPWSVESDNLLIEWINPNEEDSDVEEYQFRYIYVPIRVYGVPEKFRTPDLMKFVIEKSALPSDLHPPPDINMIVRKDYIQAYAKMDILKPVKDKVKYFVSPKDYILFYLNYDKVKRICIFCGMMFHTVQNCPSRSKLIRHLQSIKANTAAVPFSNIGIWTSQAWKIPEEAHQQASIVGRNIQNACSKNTKQLNVAKLKISEGQVNQNFDFGKTDLCLKHSNPHSSSQFDTRLDLEPPPQLGGSINIKKQDTGYRHTYQKQKRQAESDLEPMEEDGENHRHSRLKTNHLIQTSSPEVSHRNVLNTGQNSVFWPPSIHTQQVMKTNEKIHTSAPDFDQTQQNSLNFSEGSSQSHAPERRKVRLSKRRCNVGRVNLAETTIKQPGLEGNHHWNLSSPNKEDQLNMTVKEIVQGSDHYQGIPRNSYGTSHFTEADEISKGKEQAAAPAFKAPRAQ